MRWHEAEKENQLVTPSGTAAETVAEARTYTSTKALKKALQSPNSKQFDRIRQTTATCTQTAGCNGAKASVKACPPPRKSVSRRTSSSRPNESVAKHIAFTPSEVEPESPKPIKRSRDRHHVLTSKKSRSQTEDSSRLRLQLLREGHSSPVYFPCFPEETVIKDNTVRGQVIEADCDDDCQTDEEQAEDAKNSLREYLESAILRESARKPHRRGKSRSKRRRP